MAAENRAFTHTLNGELSAAEVNQLQEEWTPGWEATNSDLSPTVAVEGGEVTWSMFTYATAGPVTVLDDVRDWRDRILEVRLVMVTAANELPKGANYDPNLVAAVKARNTVSTETGATPVAAPVGYYWTPVVNQYLYAASAAGGGAAIGDLCWSNNTGADTYGMIWILQSSDIS